VERSGTEQFRPFDFFRAGAGVFAPLALKICNSRCMRRKKGGIYILGKMRNGTEQIFLYLFF
jgi:hypothetical protein